MQHSMSRLQCPKFLSFNAAWLLNRLSNTECGVAKGITVIVYFKQNTN